jgi:hypothetical protein
MAKRLAEPAGDSRLTSAARAHAALGRPRCAERLGQLAK